MRILKKCIIVPMRYAKIVSYELPEEKVNTEERYFVVIHDLLICCKKITLYRQLSGSSEKNVFLTTEKKENVTFA